MNVNFEYQFVSFWVNDFDNFSKTGEAQGLSLHKYVADLYIYSVSEDITYHKADLMKPGQMTSAST